MVLWTIVVCVLCPLYLYIWICSLGLASPGTDKEEPAPWGIRGRFLHGDVSRNHSKLQVATPDDGGGVVKADPNLLHESIQGIQEKDSKTGLDQGQAGATKGSTNETQPAGIKASSGEASRSATPRVYFELHVRTSCQGYVEEPPIVTDLQPAKDACIANDKCHAVECPHGQDVECTMRKGNNPIDYEPADCYAKYDPEDEAAKVHPAYNKIIKEYPFQQVTTQDGQQVNIILVRTPFGASGDARHERSLYDKYKKDILFLGISSFEDYPLDAMNPYSPRIDVNYFLGAFPGFLHMMHQPEKHFPPHVKTMLMSQSDFQLPDVPLEDLSAKKDYDFTYAATWPLGSNPKDTACEAWSGYCKNWSFVKQALHVMCEDYNLRGVLVATRGDSAEERCAIPDSCKGKITQTAFLSQPSLFNFFKKSRFAFVPQMHDASPRVATQALVHDVPLLMNKHISGGWKYVNEKTGEFFHDMSDFSQSLSKILRGAATPDKYQPRKWVLENYGNEHAGKRLLAFVKDNFADRVHLPKNTKLLLT